MTLMAICRFHMAKRFLTLHLGFNVCILVGEHHIRLHAAQVQTATTDAGGANRLAPALARLPRIYVLNEQNCGTDVVGRAYLRI